MADIKYEIVKKIGVQVAPPVLRRISKSTNGLPEYY
jgi:hypothetical protein